jgi:predicted PurR-regulated permease PerM
MVIVAILMGAELGGILGMFVAVPIAAIIKALAVRFLPPAPSDAVTGQHLETKERT